MPYLVPRTRFRKVKLPSFRNSFWENWGPLGSYTGYGLILFGTCLSVIEIVRILYGPTYRGSTNYDLNDNIQFSDTNAGLLFPIHGPGNFPLRVEKFHYWPWTYAANLFGLVAFFAGITGVISSYRRSYSSIFAFLSLSLLTALLSGFLIGYYSILINYYKRVGLDTSANRPDTFDVSWGLIGTNLAFSCATCLFGIIGFLSSSLGIRAGSPKGLQVNDALNSNNNDSQIRPPVFNGPIRTFNQPGFNNIMPSQMFYAPS